MKKYVKLVGSRFPADVRGKTFEVGETRGGGYDVKNPGGFNWFFTTTHVDGIFYGELVDKPEEIKSGETLVEIINGYNWTDYNLVSFELRRRLAGKKWKTTFEEVLE